MTDRFVTVPDSLELPAAVKVPVARLVGPTGAAATPADLGAATAEQGEKADASDVTALTLTAPLALTVPAGFPAGQVYRVTLTQDGTGGHTVTYGGSPVTVDTTAGAQTEVELWPNGTATRTVVYPGAAAPGASSTITADDRMATHRVRVQNGEKAQIQFSQSQPIQWVQAASAQSTTLSVRGASATQNMGAINQERAMLETGYTLVLTPRWGGGSKPVQAVLDLQTSSVDAGTVGDASSSTRSQLRTTVTVPLRQWVTVATSGSSAASGTYRSAGASGGLQLIQIRISPQ